MLAGALDRTAEEPLYLRTFNRVRENAVPVLRACATVLAILAVSAVAGCGGSGLLTTNDQIYLVPAAGGHARRLTNRSPASLGPAWSPDGTRLAFVSGRNLVVAAHGKPLTTMPLPGFPTSDSPSWAPDGQRLAVSMISRDEKRTSVVVARADGSSVGIVAQTRAGTGSPDRGPEWSPDGRLLAYALQGPDIEGQGGVRASGELDLAVVSPDGSGHRTLTTTSGYESDPRWSPDGRWILYASEVASEESAALRLVPAGGGCSRVVVRLSAVWGASWSPDGNWIAFAGDAPGELRTHLYVVRPDGTGLKRLTGEITPVRPVWSPNGRLIAFGTYAPDIDVIAPDGTGRRTVVSIPGAEIRDLAWSPYGQTIAFAAEKQPPES
jgi:TolB protein